MAARSNCRSALDMNIAPLPLRPQLPLRHWLIAISGLASGMTLALLIR